MWFCCCWRRRPRILSIRWLKLHRVPKGLNNNFLTTTVEIRIKCVDCSPTRRFSISLSFHHRICRVFIQLYSEIRPPFFPIHFSHSEERKSHWSCVTLEKLFETKHVTELRTEQHTEEKSQFLCVSWTRVAYDLCIILNNII